MLERTRELARSWLQKKEVDAIFGLRNKGGYLAPYLFNTEDELADLSISNQYRICHTCRPAKKNILSLMQARDPKLRIGVVCKGCDERALIELAKRSQLDLERIKILGVACTAEEAAECECERPYPGNLLVGDKVAGHSGHPGIDELLKKDIQQRFEFWCQQLGKCIKCYGCRNACPVCFCTDCKMEQELFVKVGRLPPEVPMFQFIRLIHIADKCTGCGECEKACPSNIPLTLITKLLKHDMKELFDYEAGLSVDNESPILLTLDAMPLRDGAGHGG
ncbi:MAG: 4Fe-4S binding protein [Deltaproteobacteria bacterium]|nr:4Fe-4S binding protein [Deltaproteobacteria bacterium]